MKPKIKICGINDAEFAECAEALGADYLGFIFAASSPRRIDADFVLAARRRLRGAAEPVGVFAETPAAEILATARTCGFRIVQLHRRAAAADVRLLRAAGLEVWTLAGGAEGDAVIFDSSHGDGETQLRSVDGLSVLAGGVSSANLSAAVASGADVIDVSGSLESAPGVKSAERLREFFAELKTILEKTPC